MSKIILLLSSQQENRQSTIAFHGMDSWSCNMNCALWSSRDHWQLNHSGYDEFWNLTTMWIQMWFHVTSKTLNLRDARRAETQSNDILSLKHLVGTTDFFSHFRILGIGKKCLNSSFSLYHIFRKSIRGVTGENIVFLTQILRNLRSVCGRKMYGKSNHTSLTTSWN